MNLVTPPYGVKGSAPVSPAPKSNVAVEPGEQFYERALQRRIRSWPDVSAAGFLTVELSQYLKGTGGATAEAVMAALLRLGHDGLVANGRRLASRLDTLTVSEARDVLEACGLAAERHARAMTRACEKDPEGISEREARERALCPVVTARLTGTYQAIPWDARHDGLLLRVKSRVRPVSFAGPMRSRPSVLRACIWPSAVLFSSVEALPTSGSTVVRSSSSTASTPTP